MATLLKVLNNLADIKSAGVLHFASELRRRRKRQWTLTSMAAAPPRYRPDIRPGNPGDRPHDQPHAPQMPRVQDAIPSLACRAWKGRSNPLLLTALRFAPESRPPILRATAS